MDRETFESKMLLAEAKILTGDRPDCWRGYQSGLMRQYHGDSVVSLEEHREWMDKAAAENQETYEADKGYMDGYIA